MSLRRKSFLIAGASAIVAGCTHRTLAGARFEDIGASGGPLKTTFNEDADKVRILMLVSPT